MASGCLIEEKRVYLRISKEVIELFCYQIFRENVSRLLYLTKFWFVDVICITSFPPSWSHCSLGANPSTSDEPLKHFHDSPVRGSNMAQGIQPAGNEEEEEEGEEDGNSSGKKNDKNCTFNQQIFNPLEMPASHASQLMNVNPASLLINVNPASRPINVSPSSLLINVSPAPSPLT